MHSSTLKSVFNLVTILFSFRICNFFIGSISLLRLISSLMKKIFYLVIRTYFPYMFVILLENKSNMLAVLERGGCVDAFFLTMSVLLLCMSNNFLLYTGLQGCYIIETQDFVIFLWIGNSFIGLSPCTWIGLLLHFVCHRPRVPKVSPRPL